MPAWARLRRCQRQSDCWGPAGVATGAGAAGGASAAGGGGGQSERRQAARIVNQLLQLGLQGSLVALGLTSKLGDSTGELLVGQLGTSICA